MEKALYNGTVTKFSRILLVWSLVFLPALLALLHEGENIQLFSFGKLNGLACASALAVSIILGCRSFWLDRFFGSLSVSYHVHHQVSLVALLFVGLHIWGSALPFFTVDFMTGWEFLGDLSDPVVLSGWIGLSLLMVGIGFSYWKKLNRPVWLWMHRILILSFPVSLIHFWMGSVRVDIAEILVFSYSAAAIMVLLMHFFYSRVLRQTSFYKIMAAKNLGPDTVEISMAPENGGILFSPGQFAYLSVDCTQGCGVSHEFHPYTLDSDPLDQRVSIAIKALGDDSLKLLHVRSGNRATLEGPYGNLFKKMKSIEPQLWIAGGIGITPFISYLRHWRKNPDAGEDIYLILFLKNIEDNVFSEEYSDLKGLRVVVHVDERDGLPNLKNLLPQDWGGRSVVISGAAKMVRAFKRDLYKMGARKIRTEEFDF